MTRYDVYVRNAGAPFGASPAWSGKPAPDGEGVLSALVTFTPAASGANYFAVVAVTSDAESSLSGEVATGTPIACHTDSCTTRTACDFGVLDDGTTCAAGGDPCGAICVAGACSDNVGSGITAALKQLRFTTRRSDVKMVLKGKFPMDAVVDAARSGAVLELRAVDGTVLYTATIPGSGFSVGGDGRRFHFVAPRQDPDPLLNGLTRFDLRQAGEQWSVSGQAKSADLAAAAAEPTVTLVLRFGTTCVRQIDAVCAQRSSVSLCR